MISLVIPVFNEQDSLTTLHAEIAEVAQKAALDVEVLFVDDGSTDGSWQVVTDLARRHAWVHGIRFRRNFGQTAAFAAGPTTRAAGVGLTASSSRQRSPRLICTCTARRAAPGPGRSSCGRGSSRSRD